MKTWFLSNKQYIAGAILGLVAGYFYWREVGCASGTCLITSRPLNSSLYGAFMGTLIGGLFRK